jgi:hypothetical protein
LVHGFSLYPAGSVNLTAAQLVSQSDTRINGKVTPIEAPMLDPHGRVALMLCEALVHALVEERVLTKGKALSVIETVVDLTREIAETDTSATGQIAVDLVEAIDASFRLKHVPPSR